MFSLSNVEPSPSPCKACRYNEDCPLAPEEHDHHSPQYHSMRVLHRGEQLFHAGARAEACYRIRTGCIRLSVIGADAGEQVMGFFGPGEWVGIDAMQACHHASDAVALDTTAVCVAHTSALKQLSTHSPKRLCRLMVALGQRLHEQEALHLSLAHDGALQRMANFLLNLSARRRAALLDQDEIALPMSRGDIASYLALAVETVSRLLTSMQRRGIIELSRHHVRIVDRDALLQLSYARAPKKYATAKTAMAMS